MGHAALTALRLRTAFIGWAVAGSLVAGVAPGCRLAPTEGPEKLHALWRQALAENDPKAAYALLAPDEHERTPWPTFLALWQATAPERAALHGSTGALDGNVVQTARTHHASGRELAWRRNSDRWQVIGGLPTALDRSAPEVVLRALVVAMRAMENGPVTNLIAADEREHLADQWRRRAAEIEAALAQPGALRVDEATGLASLRYGEVGSVELIRTDNQWWIRSFD